MNQYFLFSILTFPQYFKDDVLKLRMVIFPRLNPFKPLDGDGGVQPAFADANLQFRALLLNSPDEFPTLLNATKEHVFPAAFTLPANRGDLYNQLKNHFQIVDDDPTHQFANAGAAPKIAIRKYLTESYRSSFAFSRPRTPFCVTDDSFHCAVKQAKKPKPDFNPSPESITWAKAFAWCLRNHHLSEKMGFILETEIPLDADFYKEGGWIYLDLANESDYFALANDRRLYAARIPALGAEDKEKGRALFASVVFPVNGAGVALDEYLREAAAYDDGFAKIVHSTQPVSQHLLNEKVEANHQPPLKDLGIRLGWDDEQVAIWLNRAVSGDPKSQLGVFQYRIDTRLVDVENNDVPLTNWQSLTQVEYNGDTTQPLNNLMENFTGELGIEVNPVQINGEQEGEFWLPMFFSQWHGTSLAIPDERAFDLQFEGKELEHKPSRKYKPLGLEEVPLQYGKRYEFRVRLSDMSGGGPKVDQEPRYSAPASTVKQSFRRYVIPKPVEILNLPQADNPANPQKVYQIQRPRLGYPALLFTEFGADTAWNLLRQDKAAIAVHNAAIVDETIKPINREYGWYDPDVDRFEILVELKTLALDNFESVASKLSPTTGDLAKRLTSAEAKSNYIKLYNTERFFSPINIADPDSLGILFDLNLQFEDIPVIEFGDNFETWVENTFNTKAEDDVVLLPSARDIRITLTPLGKKTENYFGAEWVKRGKSIQFNTRSVSTNEQNLFTKDGLLFNPADVWRCIYLQPDSYPTSNQKDQQAATGKKEESPSDMVARLASAVGLEPKNGMSLIAKKGRRALFGAAKEIRCTLSPDYSSITFATKADLSNHWLSVLSLTLKRDWTWDALDVNAFEIRRRKKFTQDVTWGAWEVVGYIQNGNAVNIQALNQPDRTQTFLYFIDAVEPKPADSKFPDTIELEYEIEPRFKPEQTPVQQDEPPYLYLQNMTLPVATNPTQVPKIIAAGVALSPYRADENYASTESRQKMLWLEFEQPIENPDDTYFARVLAYSPDPMLYDVNLRNNPPTSFYPSIPINIPDESALPIEPEFIRFIIPNQAHDRNGLDAMQEMIPATMEEGKLARHYLLPLPLGLTADSKELLGFFVYELRVGHKDIWCTAQGRYGAALRVTGVQHPAPDLTCNASLSTKTLDVYAPFATPLLNGQTMNFSIPNQGDGDPWEIRTTLWVVLYAQVKQADGTEYRNIRLSEKRMGLYRPKNIIRRRDNQNEYEYPQWDTQDPLGHAIWKRDEITLQLQNFGIPTNAPLSVLAVEILPTKRGGFDQPLGAELGKERILRTSPLVAVGDICCEDC